MPKIQENPEFESKSIQFKVDESGKVSATIATFGVIDSDYDIVEPSAFKSGQEVAMVWSHDWSNPVGKGLITVTQTEAIFEGSFFMETVAGQEAYKTVKAMGTLQEWSWGFHTVKSSLEEQEERMIRHLIETEVYEVSPVLKGAGIGTRTLMLKGRQSLETQVKAVVEAVDSLGERVRSLKGLRKEQGREISEERVEELKGLVTNLREGADELEKVITPEPETPVVDPKVEFNKFLSFEARQNGVGKGN
jgi:HK97 family phage prohead protease